MRPGVLHIEKAMSVSWILGHGGLATELMHVPARASKTTKYYE